jgi:hypothetical protein
VCKDAMASIGQSIRRPSRTGELVWLKAIANARRTGARGDVQSQSKGADHRGRLGFRPEPAYTARRRFLCGADGAYVVRDRAAARSFSFPRLLQRGGPRASPAW